MASARNYQSRSKIHIRTKGFPSGYSWCSYTLLLLSLARAISRSHVDYWLSLQIKLKMTSHFLFWNDSQKFSHFKDFSLFRNFSMKCKVVSYSNKCSSDNEKSSDTELVSNFTSVFVRCSSVYASGQTEASHANSPGKTTWRVKSEFWILGSQSWWGKNNDDDDDRKK